MLKIKSKAISVLSVCVAALMFCSCGSGNNDEVDYFPFRSEKSGRWGMIAPNGEVLFDGEFKECPTVAKNGRFFVKNSNDLWEMYTAEKKPKQIEGEYLSVGVFNENVTPAVRKDEPVVLIDKNGKDVKKLDKLAGKTVVAVKNFTEGYALFKTSEGYWGAIDTKGNVVVEPNYVSLNACSDGKFLGLDKKYEDSDKGDRKVSVLNQKGKVLFSLGDDEFSDCAFGYKNGVLVVQEEDDGEKRSGLIDEKGEWKMKPNRKAKHIILGDNKKMFVFGDGERLWDSSFGLMTFDGEVVMRAKYDGLRFVTDDILAAYDENADRDERYSLINCKDETVSKNKFANIYNFTKGYAFVEIGRKEEIGIIDTKGELQKLNFDIEELNVGVGDYTMESDYVDYASIIDGLNITKEGIDGLALGVPAEKMIAAIAAGHSSVSTEPRNYISSRNVSYSKKIDPVSARIVVAFDKNIARAKKETYYVRYWYSTYPEERIVGYNFTDAKSKAVCAIFSDSGKLRGKMRSLFKELVAKAETFGKTMEKDDDEVVVDAGDGCYVKVACDEDSDVVISVEK